MPDKIENAREIFLAQGLLLLRQSGYDGLKVRDLARRCGMGSGTFYGYFPNKDDLVFQLMDLGWKDLFAKIDAVMQSGRPLHDRLAVIYRELGTRERTYRAVFAKTPVVPGRFADYYLACMARLDQTFERILSAEAENGNGGLPAETKKTAHILTRFFVCASADPEIGFEDLWRLRAGGVFRAADGAPAASEVSGCGIQM